MDLKTLDLNLFVVFDALMKTRSTTLAGRHLGMTQSAVSNALRRMRGAFDDPLFVRSRQGMMPTPFADILAASVQSGLSHMQRAADCRNAFDPATSSRAFRINMSDLAQMVFLPTLLTHFAEHARGADMVVVNMDIDQARERMVSGEIDLSVGFFLGDDPGLYRQTLFTEHYLCAVRAAHPNVRHELTLQTFLHAPHAVYRPAAGSHLVLEGLIDQLFAAHGAHRRIIVQIANLLGFSQIIANSDLLMCIPSRLARTVSRYSDIRLFPLPFAGPAFDIVQLWHERAHHDAGNRWLRRCFSDLFQG